MKENIMKNHYVRKSSESMWRSVWAVLAMVLCAPVGLLLAIVFIVCWTLAGVIGGKDLIYDLQMME